MQLSSVPSQIVEAWATGDGTKTNPIPVPSQQGITPGAASLTDGFPPLCATPIASGGIPPSKADMNGILYQMSAVDVWMCAGGGFPYNSAFQTAIGGYPKGARVLMASGNGYWVSMVDNNVTDPDTGGAGWASADENAITALTGPVTATGPGSAGATITPTGVTPGSYIGADITVNAAGQVTAAANGFTSGSNGNGYWVKDPTGRIHQWGSVSGTISTGSIIPFATPFSNASSVSVVASAIITHGSGIGYPSITNGSVTTSQFGVEMGSNPSQGIYWQADGY